MENTFKTGMRASRLADEEKPVSGEVVEVGEDMIFILWEDMNHPTSYRYNEMEGVEIAQMGA